MPATLRTLRIVFHIIGDGRTLTREVIEQSSWKALVAYFVGNHRSRVLELEFTGDSGAAPWHRTFGDKDLRTALSRHLACHGLPGVPPRSSAISSTNTTSKMNVSNIFVTPIPLRQSAPPPAHGWSGHHLHAARSTREFPADDRIASGRMNPMQRLPLNLRYRVGV